MLKLITTFALILTLSPAWAERTLSYTREKHFSGRIVKRIVSLSEHKYNPSLSRQTLTPAKDEEGYSVEIERYLSGRAGPYAKKDLLPKGLKGSVGILYEQGLTVVSRKTVKNLVEAQAYDDSSLKNLVNLGAFNSLAVGEGMTFIFEGSLVLDPGLGDFGIWTVILGGWEVTVNKVSKTKAELALSLIRSNTASFYYDKFGQMMSVDVGNEKIRGFEFVLDMRNEQAQEAYTEFFKGNVYYAQQVSYKNKAVKMEKMSNESSSFVGASLYSRTPLVAIYLYTNSVSLGEGESSETDLKDKITTNSESANYTAESSLDLIGFNHSSVRAFEVAYAKESKELEASDVYEEEYNTTPNGLLYASIQKIKNATMLDEYVDVTIPRETPVGYSQISFNVQYSEAFFEYISHGKLDLDSLHKNALERLENFYADKIKYYAGGTGEYMKAAREGNIQTIEKNIKIIEGYLQNMEKNFETKNKVFLKNYAKVMQLVYQSPFLYRAWFDEATRCGLELNYEISTTGFSKYRVNKKFKMKSSCQ